MDLTVVRGISESKSAELTKLGATLSNLHKFDISDQSKLWLKYRPLIKIPRKLAECVFNKFAEIPGTWTLTGSYRRGLSQLGDLDLVYLPESKTDIIEELKKNKNWVFYSSGSDRISGIYIFKGTAVEVDIYIVNKKNMHATILYSTGSKKFNVIMRLLAKRRGFKLNQHGLFKDDQLIDTKSEKDIFDKIGMKYVEPDKR